MPTSSLNESVRVLIPAINDGKTKIEYLDKNIKAGPDNVHPKYPYKLYSFTG